jgi:hypothetical protein
MNFKAIYNTTGRPGFPWIIERDGKRMDYGVVAEMLTDRAELVDALQWALDQIDDDLDPMHQQALAHARAVLANAKGD